VNCWCHNVIFLVFPTSRPPSLPHNPLLCQVCTGYPRNSDMLGNTRLGCPIHHLSYTLYVGQFPGYGRYYTRSTPSSRECMEQGRNWRDVNWDLLRADCRRLLHTVWGNPRCRQGDTWRRLLSPVSVERSRCYSCTASVHRPWIALSQSPAINTYSEQLF